MPSSCLRQYFTRCVLFKSHHQMSVRREELIQKMIALQADKTIGILEKLNQEYRLFSVILSQGWYLDYGLAVKTLSGLCLHQVI